MNAVIPILIIVVILLAASILATLILVIAGIHGDERHMSLTGQPRTRRQSFARRVLGVHDSQNRITPKARDQAKR